MSVPNLMLKLVYSGVFLLLVYLLFHGLQRSARRTQERMGMRRSRFFALRRLLSLSALMVGMGGLMFIWGIDPKNVWITVTGALAVVAIAFFAVWSLIGNILAGIILYFTSPFKIDDEIEVLPEEIRGQVIAINTFFTVLQDEDRNYINIPNAQFFQKYIRVRRRRGHEVTVPAEPTIEVPENED